jgi:large subunit ribosomal protein L3
MNIHPMSAGLFGKKLGMTQIFDENGIIVPVTLVKAEPCQVSQVKNKETDGYVAIQVAYFEEKLDRINKPQSGHLKKSGSKGFRSFGEFSVEESHSYKIGQTVSVNDFNIGQSVSVKGKSIGKGFAGNQKRHNFSRGPMTHGSKNHRLPGSIGAGSTPGRVYPGKKMAGHLGNKTTTIKSSKVLYISESENILVLKGSLPGKRDSILKIIPRT